jgi:opacity protein-like surface antigen
MPTPLQNLATLTLSLILPISVALAPSSAQADAGQHYFSLGGQWMDFDQDIKLDNDTGYFLGFGYDFTDRISAELSTFDLNPDK